MNAELQTTFNNISLALTNLSTTFQNVFNFLIEHLFEIPPEEKKNSEGILEVVKKNLHKVKFVFKDKSEETYILADIDALPTGNWDKSIDEIKNASLANNPDGIVVNEI